MQSYEDKFVLINENGVTVKGYYFPVGIKTIPWKNILDVEQFLSKENEIPGVTYKGWGMGYKFVYKNIRSFKGLITFGGPETFTDT